MMMQTALARAFRGWVPYNDEGEMMTSDDTTKERPILMHGRSVRGILEGRKTQTRRVIKPQPDLVPMGPAPGLDQELPPMWVWTKETADDVVFATWGRNETPDEGDARHLYEDCPYGVPGDRLYVRETFQLPRGLDDRAPSEVGPGAPATVTMPPVRYKADGAVGVRQDDFVLEGEWGRTRPSIHMPRWASRILLEVTDVRVERVQDISYEDILAEGVEEFALPEHEGDGIDHDGTMDEWRRLWDDTNSHRLDEFGWEANPWVWCVSFKVLEPKRAAWTKVDKEARQR